MRSSSASSTIILLMLPFANCAFAGREALAEEYKEDHVSRSLVFDFFGDILGNIFGGIFSGSSPASTCPSVSPAAGFSIDSYIEKSWFIQYQQPNSYQPASSLYCVAATYVQENKQQWFQPAISVNNYSTTDRVNGSPRGGGLCATTANSDEPAQLTVAPCFLPSFLGGPYWVVDFAPDYSWSIVVGGQPSTQEGACQAEPTLCTTPESSGFLNVLGTDVGLWFFTRAQVADDATIQAMQTAARNLGICTANMIKVEQEGCTYEGAVLKM